MFLNCHTWFSFKYGTLSIAGLFDEAERCGVKKIILTEINNTASYIEMMRYRKEERNYNLDFALGVEFRNANELLYIAIAKNNKGFEEINRFLSHNNSQGTVAPSRAPEFQHVFIVYPFQKIQPGLLRHYEYVGIRTNQLNHFALYHDYKLHTNKFVILHPVTFADKIGFNTHRLLRAIDNNTLLSKLSPAHQRMMMKL